MMKYAGEIEAATGSGSIGLGGYTDPRPQSRVRKALLIVLGVAAALAVVGGVGAYIYWQSLKDTPQYSLALLIDAARRNDQQAIDQLADTNALVDDFVPQVTAKAVELYGRGQSPEVIAKAAQVATPLLPAVKDRARTELPRLIREKTQAFSNVPFAGMVIGADRYLEIRQMGDIALVKSTLPEHSFEVKMRRTGERWQIIGVRDEQLATNIARAIGQEIIAVASNGGVNGNRNRLGVRNIGELLRQAEQIFSSP